MTDKQRICGSVHFEVGPIELGLVLADEAVAGGGCGVGTECRVQTYQTTAY